MRCKLRRNLARISCDPVVLETFHLIPLAINCITRKKKHRDLSNRIMYCNEGWATLSRVKLSGMEFGLLMGIAKKPHYVRRLKSLKSKSFLRLKVMVRNKWASTDLRNVASGIAVVFIRGVRSRRTFVAELIHSSSNTSKDGKLNFSVKTTNQQGQRLNTQSFNPF